jgi:ribosomal protein L40E
MLKYRKTLGVLMKQNNSSKNQISSERKTLFYVGRALMGIGLVLFLSVFVTFAFADPFAFPDSNPMAPAIVGFIMIFIGTLISNVGAHGKAGSGMILDPEQAREDLKPFSRQAGGMLNDALDAADIKEHLSVTKEIVKVRCRSCGELNDEDATYCKKCGARM